MKKILLFPLLIFFLALAYGVYLSRIPLTIYKTELEPLSPLGFYDYAGVTNVHTQKSSGSGSMNDVISAAQSAALDFIFITDLNDFTPNLTPEFYQDQTLVIIGGEYSYLDSRVLAFELPKHSPLSNHVRTHILLADYLNTPQSLDIPSSNLVLAHPFKPGYTWNRTFPPGLNGIEVINLKSIWQKKWLFSKASFMWTILTYPFNPRLALLRLVEPPKQELNLWDILNKKQFTFGMAGADADARIPGLSGSNIAFPPYEKLFQITKNHILLESELTGDPTKDARHIRNALKKGQFYFSFDLIADPRGFSSFLSNSDSKIFPIGSRLKFNKDLSIVVRLPHQLLYPYEIILLNNGVKIASAKNREVHFPISNPGVYRVLVHVKIPFPMPDGHKWTPWIYSNPFHLTP